MGYNIREYASTFDLDRPSTANDVDEALAAFRAGCPVVHTPREGGWLVTDAEHAQKVARAHEVFSARTDGGAARNLDTNHDLIAPLFDQDPDTGHTRTRRALQRFFTPRAARRWEPYVRQITQEHMAELRPRGRCEAVTEISYQLPWLITAALLGIPEHQRPTYRALGKAHFLGGDTPPFDQFLSAQIAAKRRHPGEDLITTVLTTEIEDGRYPCDEEVLRFAKIMSAAGSLTSADSISSILLELEHDRALREDLLARPELLPRLVDEIARTQAAVFASGRQVRQPTVLGGQSLPAGALVKICWYSAGRDEAVHESPDQVRLDRRPGAHAGWGSGAHHCLGRDIALRSLPVIIQTVVSAIPDYRLAPDAHPRRTVGTLRGVDTLPIQWTV
jgi:cytochrome P450